MSEGSRKNTQITQIHQKVSSIWPSHLTLKARTPSCPDAGRARQGHKALGSRPGRVCGPESLWGWQWPPRTCFRPGHQVPHEKPVPKWPTSSSFFFKLKVRKAKKIFTNQSRKVLSILSQVWLASQQRLLSRPLTRQLSQGQVHSSAFSPMFVTKTSAKMKNKQENITSWEITQD